MILYRAHPNARSGLNSGAMGGIFTRSRLQIVYLMFFISADHPVLMVYIGEIQGRHNEYCEAINMSVRAAQDGYDISHYAIILCDYLRDKTQPQENIQAFISDMKEKTTSAHKDCREMMEMFRSVNRGLLKVCYCSDAFLFAV
jgi:hypothetical protein